MIYSIKEIPDELIQGIALMSGGSWGDATLEDRQFFKRFAALVAAYEREECAKVCDDEADDGTEGEWDSCCRNLARQIRARGEK